MRVDDVVVVAPLHGVAAIAVRPNVDLEAGTPGYRSWMTSPRM